jgi:CBS domain-containing protein
MACDQALGNARKLQGAERAAQAPEVRGFAFSRESWHFPCLRREIAMTIARIIERRGPSDIIACDCATPVHEVVQTLATKRIGALPVLREGKVVGIVSERDVIYRLAEKGGTCLDLPVEEIMTSPAITVEPATTVDDALSMMTRRRFRHFPVVENGELIGFISIGDLVKHKMDEVQHEAEALRHYITAG